MESFLEEFQHLKIHLEEIKSATNNFDDNKVIGTGGFGKVYEGELSHFKGRSKVAIKRLDRRFGQGDPEFWKEIMMLSRYTHKNLISLLGFCNEGDEKILIYEHASNGSLDRLIKSTNFAWIQRLKICLDAAKGLSYLHDDKGTHQRILHRDIKSSNILLDEYWNAKVSDLGLSKIGPANQPHTALITNVVGTPGYLDPMYMEFFILTKESDVYSFGVVLFEVLCGKLCFEISNGRFMSLVRMWKQKYKQKKLDEVIFQDLIQEMDPRSLKTFSDIAFQCLHKFREDRPTMSLVAEQLENALEFQEIFEEMKHSLDYEKMIKTTLHPLTYNSKEELNLCLSKEILLNEGKTWFSLNKNGEHIEMISAAECLVPATPVNNTYVYEKVSRFPPGRCYLTHDGEIKAHVRTQFLSLQTTYTVNVVFKHPDRVLASIESRSIFIMYKLEDQREFSVSYLADVREDGWLMVELFHFDSQRRMIDLEILFCCFNNRGHSFIVEGIEFRPIEKVEPEVIDDMQTISESNDTYWGKKIPDDYDDIIKWSKDDVKWTTKKELYSILCKGFLMSNGQWFFLAKSGKRCLMVPAQKALSDCEWEWKSLSESRFGEVAFDHTTDCFSIFCNMESQILLPKMTYACYLVYKVPEAEDTLLYLSSPYDYPLLVKNRYFDDESDVSRFIYLVNPQIPVIKPKANQNSHNPLSKSKMKGIPRQREDGWMEVQVCEFRRGDFYIDLQLRLVEWDSDFAKLLGGLIVEGIVFRPE